MINKKEYESLFLENEKLKKKNQELQKEVDALMNAREILDHIGLIIDGTDIEKLNLAYQSMKKRHLLAQILGM